MKTNAFLVSAALAVAAVLGLGISADRVEAQLWCIDCFYTGQTATNPPIPGYIYFYILGQYDCEDGFTGNGQCEDCSELDIAEEECDPWSEPYYVLPQSEDMCEWDTCEASHLAVHEAAAIALATGRWLELGATIDDNPASLRVRTGAPVLEFLGCDGSVVRGKLLPAQSLGTTPRASGY